MSIKIKWDRELASLLAQQVMSAQIHKELSASHRIVSSLTIAMGAKKLEDLALMGHTTILTAQKS